MNSLTQNCLESKESQRAETQGIEPEKRREIEFLKNHIGTVVIIAVVCILYEILTDVTGVLKVIIFPGFSEIIPAFISSLPKLFESLLSSLKLLIPGYFGAAFAGIVLGMVIGLNPRLNKNLQPIIFALSPMPPSMFTPYLITILPTFYMSSVAVVFIGCFWPFLNATISGVLMVEETYLENAQVLGLKGAKRLFLVVVPAAMPLILSGAATALNFSFILLVIAEMFATNSGLGYFVQYNADYCNYANVISGLVFMGLFIIIVNTLFTLLKKRILFWKLNRNSN